MTRSWVSIQSESWMSRKLTAGIRLDLEVFGEWPARSVDGDNTRNEAPNDKSEAEPDRVAVATTQTVLLDISIGCNGIVFRRDAPSDEHRMPT